MSINAYKSLLMGIDGNEYSIENLLSKNQGLVVVFMSIQCPYALTYFEELLHISGKEIYKGLGFLLVSSNISLEDAPEDIEEMRKEFPSFTIPFVRDERRVLAKYMGATRTPQCYLLDTDFSVLYNGPIDERFKQPDEYNDGDEGYWPWDDNPPVKPPRTFLEEVLDAYISNGPIPFIVKEPIGCTIKFDPL